MSRTTWEKSNLSTFSSLLDKSLVLGMRLSIHTCHDRHSFFIVVCRLVFDRETEKPKRYGFCEFAGCVVQSFLTASATMPRYSTSMCIIIGEISITNVPYSCHLPNHPAIEVLHSTTPHEGTVTGLPHKIIKLLTLQSEITVERTTSANRPCGFRSVPRGKDHRKRWAFLVVPILGREAILVILRTIQNHFLLVSPGVFNCGGQQMKAQTINWVWRLYFWYPSFMKLPTGPRFWLVFFSP